ncbi:MAG TPA: hypothetical protein VHS96_04605, partial [Bacteroidia bacterium]|nr:hypothetical protein [Bacteroidia bacterium]
MKKLLLLLPICLLLSAKNQPKEPTFEAKKDMVSLSPGVWMARQEVSQAHYKQFLRSFAAGDSQEKQREFMPDTAVWNINGKPDAYSNYYFQHVAFEN